ncbi:MAG: hypothetical protein ACAI35_19055 [Candidatus Methylacidiphilales bacterium]
MIANIDRLPFTCAAIDGADDFIHVVSRYWAGYSAGEGKYKASLDLPADAKAERIHVFALAKNDQGVQTTSVLLSESLDAGRAEP